MRLLLLNPNTSEPTTAAMLAIALADAPAGVTLDGRTAPFGAPLITDPAALAVAADAVAALAEAERDAGAAGAIVAAFGDPGLARARAILPCPVTGIAEAGMAEAADGDRPFAVVTTTPDLADAIAEAASRYGHGAAFRGVHLTPGDPAALMADPEALAEALLGACRDAVRAGAAAVVIGGGPLAVAARAIRDRAGVPLVEPVPAAVRLACRRAGTAR